MAPKAGRSRRHPSDQVGGLLERAQAAFARGDDADCAALCREQLRRAPRHAATLHLLGVARFRLGEGQGAVEALAGALQLAPADLALRLDHAWVLAETGQAGAAIQLLAEGARFHPGHPQLAARLAALLAAGGLHADAERVLEAGLRAAPGDLELRLLLAGELAADLRFPAALAHLSVAAALAPERSEVHCNLGLVRQGSGDLSRAVAAYRRAVALSPADNQAHMNLATALLTRGEFAEGFAQFEWRLGLAGTRCAETGLPSWRGEALAGRRLLVTVEQGYGDMIQFARFLPPLAGLGGEVVLECPAALERLFAGIAGVTRIVPTDGSAGAADLAVPLLSLPFVLGASSLPVPPYLAAPQGSAFPLPAGDGLKVGLVWAGRPAQGDSYVRRSLNRRSCPMDALAPLLAVPGASFYSLQVEEGPLPAGPLHVLRPHLQDFADTAAAMAQLDLIISVDTAAAHLAGAMGRPLWVMLGPGQSDYRWGCEGEASPWYAQARLFRCPADGWAPLVGGVAAELAGLAASQPL